MSALLAIAVLLAPCGQISLLKEGTPAPCTGDLWPARLSLQALKCRKVEVPKCATTALADTLVASAKLTGCEQAATVVVEGYSPWLVGVAGVLVGIVAGVGLSR